MTAWTWLDATEDALPPDLTRTTGRPCWAAARVATAGEGGVLICTRGRGHTGRHAAGDGTQIVAVWP